MPGIAFKKLTNAWRLWSEAVLQEKVLPVRATPPHKSAIENVSPYFTDWARLAQAYGTSPHRREMITALAASLRALDRAHCVVTAVLVAGPILDRETLEPASLDCMVFYEAGEGFNVREISATAKDLRSKGVEMRFSPSDASPMLTIKAAMWFCQSFTPTENPDDGGCLLLPGTD